MTMQIRFRPKGSGNDVSFDLPAELGGLWCSHPCPWDAAQEIRTHLSEQCVTHELLDPVAGVVSLQANHYDTLLLREKTRTYCAYCGQEYPRGTPTHRNALLTEHIFQCPEHPLKAVLEAVDAVRNAPDNEKEREAIYQLFLTVDHARGGPGVQEERPEDGPIRDGTQGGSVLTGREHP